MTLTPQSNKNEYANSAKSDGIKAEHSRSENNLVEANLAESNQAESSHKNIKQSMTTNLSSQQSACDYSACASSFCQDNIADYDNQQDSSSQINKNENLTKQISVQHKQEQKLEQEQKHKQEQVNEQRRGTLLKKNLLANKSLAIFYRKQFSLHLLQVFALMLVVFASFLYISFFILSRGEQSSSVRDDIIAKWGLPVATTDVYLSVPVTLVERKEEISRKVKVANQVDLDQEDDDYLAQIVTKDGITTYKQGVVKEHKTIKEVFKDTTFYLQASKGETLIVLDEHLYQEKNQYVPRYTAEISQKFQFKLSQQLRDILARNNTHEINMQAMSIEIELDSNKGLKQVNKILFDGKELKAIPREEGGFKAIVALKEHELNSDKICTVEVSFSIQGSDRIKYQPLAASSLLIVQGQGTIPQFFGDFMPRIVDHKINEGYKVEYYQNALSLGINDISLQKPDEVKSYVMELYESESFYDIIYRLIKFIMWHCLVVTSVVCIIEYYLRYRVYTLQYLSLLATAPVFIVALLALSEHFGFALSYISATAILSIMVLLYCKAVFKLAKIYYSLIIFSITLFMYALCYALVYDERYALQILTLFLVVVLAFIMYATRNFNIKSLFQTSYNSNQNIINSSNTEYGTNSYQPQYLQDNTNVGGYIAFIILFAVLVMISIIVQFV